MSYFVGADAVTGGIQEDSGFAINGGKQNCLLDPGLGVGGLVRELGVACLSKLWKVRSRLHRS